MAEHLENADRSMREYAAGVNWGHPYWVVGGVVHQIDFDAPGEPSGLCICGRKTVAHEGVMLEHCRKVADAMANEEHSARSSPTKPPSLAGWWVRLSHEYGGWRWHAWSKWDEPYYLAPDRDGRTVHPDVSDLVLAAAKQGSKYVNIDGSNTDLVFDKAALEAFGAAEVTVKVEYGW